MQRGQRRARCGAHLRLRPISARTVRRVESPHDRTCGRRRCRALYSGIFCPRRTKGGRSGAQSSKKNENSRPAYSASEPRSEARDGRVESPFFAVRDSHTYQCTCAHAKDELSFCAHVPTHRMVRPSRPIGPTARAAFIAPVHAVYTSAAGRYMGIDPCPT